MKLNENGDSKATGGASPVGKLKLSVPNGAENAIAEPSKDSMPKDTGKEKDIAMSNSGNGGMMSPESLEAT